MAGHHDDVVLSHSELERMSAIEESLMHTDPVLVERLRRHPPDRSRGRVLVGTVLVVFGLAVLLTTFTRWLWVGTAGLALMTAGALLAAPCLTARFTVSTGGSVKRPERFRRAAS